MIRFLDYDALLFMNFISVTFWKCAFHFEYSINKSFLWLAKCEWYRHTKFHHVTSHTTHGTREPDGRPCYYSHTDTTQPVQIHFLCRHPWPASPTRCQNISSHTHEYEQAGTRCMSGPCLLLAAWQMGRSEGRARHCPCLPSACFQQHNIPPRPLHKFSAQIFDSDWWICCAWPMTGRDCVRAILRMFEMLCVLTSRWKRDYFVCQKPDIRTCSGGPARHCTDSVE